jgi:hypothetical protein
MMFFVVNPGNCHGFWGLGVYPSKSPSTN